MRAQILSGLSACPLKMLLDPALCPVVGPSAAIQEGKQTSDATHTPSVSPAWTVVKITSAWHGAIYKEPRNGTPIPTTIPEFFPTQSGRNLVVWLSFGRSQILPPPVPSPTMTVAGSSPRGPLSG